MLAVRRASEAELRRDIVDVRDDLERLDGRVVEAERQLGALREKSGRIEGRVEHLTAAYERAATVATNQVMADLEVKKADALALIDDRKEVRRARRDLLVKFAAGGTVLWTIVAAMLQKGC